MKSKTAQLSKYLLVFFSLLCFVGSLTPMIQTNYADSAKDKEKIIEEAKNFDGGDEDGFFEKTNGLKGKFDREETMSNLYKYMFMKGNYIQEVTKGVLGDKKEGVDDTVVQDKGDTKTVCYFDKQPQNALNHNCDVPTFASQLGQVNYALQNPQGVLGAQITSSKSDLGVPAGIPGDDVPVFASERVHKYTGLELFGYNLHYTTYVGEWDNIVPQTQARLLSNFGFWTKAKLGATSVFNGVKGAIDAAVTKFDWNPIKYISNIVDGATGSVLWTIVDTSDLNVIATHAWARPEFSGTVYNAYYMSSKEVYQKGQAWLLAVFEQKFSEIKSPNSEVQKMLDLSIRSDKFPKFKYKKKVETADSKAARKAAKKSKQDVPEKVYESRADQFEDWKTQNADFLAQASSVGINCSDKELYGEFISCYDEAWNKYASKVVQDNKKDVDETFTKLAKEYAEKNPHFDPAKSLSHYVCADESGTPTGQTMADWKYAYEKENSADAEFLGGCSELRPSIKGALYGNGEGDFSDTRYKHFITKGKIAKNNGQLSPIGSLFNSIAVICAKITNTMLSLSFSNILKELGITDMVAKVVEIFRDSIFYPLSTIGIVLSAFWILVSCFRMGFGRQAYALILLIFITFGTGVALLAKPEQTVQLIEEIPTKIDNFLMNVITEDTNDRSVNELCSASGGDSTGVRGMQCQVWKMDIFDPWVYGQWGTSYTNLDASDFSNSNKSLVGEAAVNMGGNTIVKNWALYQLNLTKSGTITKTNPKETDNTLDRNIYRLVDLQAGPKNGAKSDGKYLTQWSGAGQNRDSYQIRGAIVSICVMFLMGGLAIAKIEYTFLIAIQIFILPIQLALSLFPGGNIRFKNYFEGLLNLFVKRFLIVIVMSLALLMLTAVDSSSDNYNTVFFGVVIIAVAVKLYWKQMVNLFAVTTNGTSNFMTNNLRSQLSMQNMPKFLQRRIPKYTTGVRDFVAGGVGGAIAGISAKAIDETKGISKGSLISYITEGSKKGSAQAYHRFNMMNENRQRKEGFSAYDTLGQIRESVAQHQRESFTNNKSVTAKNWNNMETVLRNEIAEHEHKKSNEDYHIKMKSKQLEKLQKSKNLSPNDEARANQLEEEIKQHHDNKEALLEKDSNIEAASELLDRAKESNYKFENNKVNGNFLAMQPGQREIKIDNNGNKVASTISTEEAVERFIDTAPANMALIKDDEEKALRKNIIEGTKEKVSETVSDMKAKYTNTLEEFKDKTGFDFNDELPFEDTFWTKPYTVNEKTGKKVYGESEADKLINEYDETAPELATALREMAILAKESSNGLIKSKPSEKSIFKKSTRKTFKDRFKKGKEKNPTKSKTELLKEALKGNNEVKSSNDKFNDILKSNSKFNFENKEDSLKFDIEDKDFENPFDE